MPVEQTDFKNDEERANYPVVNVTLYQASNYCQWLGQRLPTQAEWERAVRGPDGEEWPWGNGEPTRDRANMPWGDFVPEGLLPINSNPSGVRDGIYNLIGNVREWTSSLAVPMTDYDPTHLWNGNPEKYDGTKDYIQVGGGWREKTDETALYNAGRGTDARADLGFRCAADIK